MFEQALQVVLDDEMRNLCTKPYHNHPRGCPNYGKRPVCPPIAMTFEQVYQPGPIYLIWTTFNFGDHCAKMRAKHPSWTEPQVRCCLYWQGTARKYHKKEVEWFKLSHPSNVVTSCPEATGVNVTQTMAHQGQFLEWPPEKLTYQVSLAGKVIEYNV